jgi:diguanylate cyclase (GGDEF)-like protein/PAS domain S-box-containing protein
MKSIDTLDYVVPTFPSVSDLPELLEICIGRLNDAIVITEAEPINSPGPRIIWANKVFFERNGYTPEEIIGQSPRILQGPLTDRDTLDRVRSALEKWQSIRAETLNYRKDGTTYWNEFEIVPIANENGWFTHWVSVQRDITERKLLETEIRHLAFYDSLTKLPNRRLLSDRLSQAFSASKRSTRYGALMFLDLDNFKPLNDTHGHVTGELLLIEVADRLKNCVREMDTVARFGGDEFVIILSELDTENGESVEQARVVAEKIRIALSEPYLLKVKQESQPDTTIQHYCTTSIGVALFINHETSQYEILKHADAAMYQAKEAGRNQTRFYEEKV